MLNYIRIDNYKAKTALQNAGYKLVEGLELVCFDEGYNTVIEGTNVPVETVAGESLSTVCSTKNVYIVKGFEKGFADFMYHNALYMV